MRLNRPVPRCHCPFNRLTVDRKKNASTIKLSMLNDTKRKKKRFLIIQGKKQILSTSSSLDSRSHSQVSLVSGLKRSSDWKPGGVLGGTSVIPPTHCAAPLPRTLPVTLRVVSVCLQSEQQESAGQPRGAAWPNRIDGTRQT